MAQSQNKGDLTSMSLPKLLYTLIMAVAQKDLKRFDSSYLWAPHSNANIQLKLATAETKQQIKVLGDRLAGQWKKELEVILQDHYENQERALVEELQRRSRQINEQHAKSAWEVVENWLEEIKKPEHRPEAVHVNQAKALLSAYTRLPTGEVQPPVAIESSSEPLMEEESTPEPPMEMETTPETPIDIEAIEESPCEDSSDQSVAEAATKKQDKITDQQAWHPVQKSGKQQVINSHPGHVPAKGFKDPLSNFYHGSLYYLRRKHMSGEHVYQTQKCHFLGLPEMAERLGNTQTAMDCKVDASKYFRSREFRNMCNKVELLNHRHMLWEGGEKFKLARLILNLKLEQTKEFGDKLHSTGRKYIYHPVTDMSWGTGSNELTPVGSGANRLGYLLMELRRDRWGFSIPTKPTKMQVSLGMGGSQADSSEGEPQMNKGKSRTPERPPGKGLASTQLIKKQVEKAKSIKQQTGALVINKSNQSEWPPLPIKPDLGKEGTGLGIKRKREPKQPASTIMRPSAEKGTRVAKRMDDPSEARYQKQPRIDKQVATVKPSQITEAEAWELLDDSTGSTDWENIPDQDFMAIDTTQYDDLPGPTMGPSPVIAPTAKVTGQSRRPDRSGPPSATVSRPPRSFTFRPLSNSSVLEEERTPSGDASTPEVPILGRSRLQARNRDNLKIYPGGSQSDKDRYWKPPTVSHKSMIIGDSIMAGADGLRPRDAISTHVYAYRGMKLEHTYKVLGKMVDSPMHTVQNLILAVGVNNRDQRVANTSGRLANMVYNRAKEVFPSATIYFPKLPQTAMSREHQRNLKELEDKFEDLGATLLNYPPNLKFKQDKLHLIPESTNRLLDSWINQVTASDPF